MSAIDAAKARGEYWRCPWSIVQTGVKANGVPIFKKKNGSCGVRVRWRSNYPGSYESPDHRSGVAIQPIFHIWRLHVSR